MLLAVLQEGVFSYDYEMIIILYPVHRLIYYLLISVCCFVLFDFNLGAGMLFTVLQEVISFV